MTEEQFEEQNTRMVALAQTIESFKEDNMLRPEPISTQEIIDRAATFEKFIKGNQQ